MHDLLRLDACASGATHEFSGICCAGKPDRAFGGLTVAHALLAAHRTVAPAWHVHSLHAYFLAMGRPDEKVRYRVRTVRDGGTYTLREVTALQGTEELLTLTASFKRPEPGPDRHVAMPPTPAPESLPDRGEAVDRLWSGITPSSAIRQVVQVRPVDGDAADDDADQYGSRARRMWIRFSGRLSDDPALHSAALSFCSDLTLGRTAALGHLDALGGGNPAQRLFLASIDHAMWFHRQCRADDWLLYVHHSRTSGDGRGLTTGEFWTREGALVATVTQEVLLRERRTTPTADRSVLADVALG
ncbi:acyl-CoA thioesterase [Rhodococcus artemisiae]|uniref:Thioesterase family protein n=1 Tax=Rhodococcus artemisiae TaxID=714159 RepID=A0ABU7LBY0_9NOCA|nr:acyl-CoA thioesterase domain-containing protein [Rhodococcus artemisiae]MEE2058814.1 thioesterase family protein [Rhodococcus artemisiae]